jgi:SOS response associated peptidase (SRAP)
MLTNSLRKTSRTFLSRLGSNRIGPSVPLLLESVVEPDACKSELIVAAISDSGKPRSRILPGRAGLPISNVPAEKHGCRKIAKCAGMLVETASPPFSCFTAWPGVSQTGSGLACTCPIFSVNSFPGLKPASRQNCRILVDRRAHYPAASPQLSLTPNPPRPLLLPFPVPSSLIQPRSFVVLSFASSVYVPAAKMKLECADATAGGQIQNGWSRNSASSNFQRYHSHPLTMPRRKVSNPFYASTPTPDNRNFPMRWGLIPFWAGPGAFNRLTFNARAEELNQKPTFRDALKSRRCLVPADVFYEWRRSEKRKQPFAIAFTNQRPFAFAGLWDSWKAEDGTPIESFTIATTKPNSLMI